MVNEEALAHDIWEIDDNQTCQIGDLTKSY
jgi:hypothetical protein